MATCPGKCTVCAFRDVLSVYVYTPLFFDSEGGMWDLIVFTFDHCSFTLPDQTCLICYPVHPIPMPIDRTKSETVCNSLLTDVWDYITAHEQTQSNRVCYFRYFDMFLASKGSSFRTYMRAILLQRINVNDSNWIFVLLGQSLWLQPTCMLI